MKIRVIMVSAVVILLLPALGIPGAWKSTLTLVLGILIVATIYLLHRDIVSSSISHMLSKKREKVTEAFSENGPREELKPDAPHHTNGNDTESR